MHEKNTMIPDWIRTAPYDKESFLKTKELVQEYNLNTVCMEADCPNRYECFSKGTATFMILGDTCTRNCRYCNINKGKPKEVDPDEPQRIAQAVKKLDLNYAVITCVTRDDLEDGGAGQFARTIERIRKLSPGCKIEVLISDMKGDLGALKKIIDAGPDVLNHNIEVVRGLFSELRPQGNYDVSLKILEKGKESGLKTKSGFMLGFGEDESQIINTLRDLRDAGCNIVTIGQYLKPDKGLDVRKYYTPEEFKGIEEKANKLGIRGVLAGPLVRSSYKAGEI
ncbi:MAG: lipoyl synthase [Candidatus Woesearchaeota archaeon]